MEYVIDQLIEQVCEEIATKDVLDLNARTEAFRLEQSSRQSSQKIIRFNRHALIKAQAKEYIGNASSPDSPTSHRPAAHTLGVKRYRGAAGSIIAPPGGSAPRARYASGYSQSAWQSPNGSKQL